MAENIQETANETKSKKQIYDEQKAERLAKREKELKLQAKKETKENKPYKNPINNKFGKALIIILSLSMVAGIIFSFVYALINL